MHLITLEHETDFDGWRRAARALVFNDVPPSEVAWRVRDTREPDATALEAPQGTFNVPAKFVELAKLAILHRDPNRFALLYRLLWRLRGHHDLLMAADDPDVAQILVMADAVDRDIRHMQAQLRFRESAASRRRITSPGSRRRIISWQRQRLSSPAVLPTCPGRSSHQMPARIGTVMP